MTFRYLAYSLCQVVGTVVAFGMWVLLREDVLATDLPVVGQHGLAYLLFLAWILYDGYLASVFADSDAPERRRAPYAIAMMCSVVMVLGGIVAAGTVWFRFGEHRGPEGSEQRGAAGEPFSPKVNEVTDASRQNEVPLNRAQVSGP